MNDGRKAFLFINFCRHRRYFIDAKFMNNDDLLKLYGDRLMALRLQDNGGKYNQYQLPLDGNIDWLTVMRKISLTGYKGAYINRANELGVIGSIKCVDRTIRT